MAKLIVAVVILVLSAASETAEAGSVVCSLPRALLCEGCASGIVVSLTPVNGCRIAFTPGTTAPAAEGAVPITFVIGASSKGGWTKRLKAAPAPAVTGRDRCLVFNGNQYCE